MENKQKNRGARLKAWRQSRGLKLKDLAARTGLSIGFLSKIENGTGNPSVDNIQKICYVLGVTPNDLLTQKSEEEILVVTPSPKEQELLQTKDQECLMIRGTSYVEEGIPFEYFEIVAISDFYKFRSVSKQ